VNVLVDAAIPDSVTRANAAGVRVARWTEGEVDDEELVNEAKRMGFDAVVVIGRAMLGDGRLARAARESSIALIATVTTDPLEAATYLAARLVSIRNRVQPGEVWLLRSDQLEQLDTV
jgi:hypothetical protein